MNTARLLLVLGALFGALGVLAGAFGAHALRTRLDPGALATFETAVRYQMYHAIALVGLGALGLRWHAGALLWAGWLFAIGIVIFSGSLYLVSLTGGRSWGSVTPVGGLCLIGGWLGVVWAAWQAR